MKLDDHFKTLLEDTVNLSQYSLDVLEQRVQAIYNALADDLILGPLVRDKIPQGSWPHQTIIKPASGREFDADFLLLLDENPDWAGHPKKYIEEIYAALGRSATYKSMERHRKCRCVRLVYAEAARCHVDIVAYLRLADGREVIVNRDEDDWEDTDPDGFTEWMRGQDEIAKGNLRRVIRLLKYLRDHCAGFEGTRSIILTTLVGERVSELKTFADPGYYGSVATALRHIVDDLDDWLQGLPGRPSIADPSGSGVTFDHRWSDETFEHFRDRIHMYAEKIAVAYDEPDKETSVTLWQEIFGDGFHAPPQKESSGRFAPVAPLSSRSGRAG